MTYNLTMENILQELPRVSWSYRSYTANELAKRAASFPMVVKTTGCLLGDTFYQGLSNDQVLYLHSVKEQFRFLAYDSNENEISIPINSPVTFLEPLDAEVILAEHMILPQNIKIDLRHSKLNLSQLICLTEEDEIILNVKRRGWMKYLLGVGLSKGEVGSYMESIPVDYSGIQFFVALDIRNETIEDFLKFESCVTDLVSSTHQHQLDSYQGNTDFIINAQPNLIELLEEMSTAIELQVNDSSHPHKSKGKHKRKVSYTDIDISEVKTSSTYQDLTSVSPSLDGYDYPDSDSDDGYEKIDEDFQLNNDSRHVYNTDDDYEQFIEAVVNNRRTAHQSTPTSPIRLPIEESAKEVEVPQRNTKSKGKKNASSSRKSHHFFTMPKPFKQKADASSTLPARVESQHKTTRQDDKIQGTEDLPDDLSTLTGRQVQDCLRLLKLEKYLEVFEDLGIDGCLLVDMDEDMMKNELHFTRFQTLKLNKFITTKWLPS